MGYTVYSGTAASLNGDNIPVFNVGDRIDITDLTPSAAHVQVSGNHLTYDGSDSITIGNLGPGRYVVRAVGTTGTEIRLQPDAHNDFTGDGRSDVLWQSDDGTVTDWIAQPDGTFAGNPNLVTQVPTDWHIVGTGDFNGDGTVDVLWQNSSGYVTDWLSKGNGTFAGNSNLLTQVPSDWHVVGTGDFNADGRTDVLWQNNSGAIIDWLAQPDGTFSGNSASYSAAFNSSWHVVGTGDFNGDGVDDILWRNDDGTVTDWLGQSNGTFVSNQQNLSTKVDPSWHIVGTGDFNGDGFTDILWQNNNGAVMDWLGQSNGTFSGNNASLSTALDSTWHVAQIGDFNGDGIDDILWRNNSGTVTEWFGQSNGTFISNQQNLHTAVPTNWHVEPPMTGDLV